jgi:hypothetical protein
VLGAARQERRTWRARDIVLWTLYRQEETRRLECGKWGYIGYGRMECKNSILWCRPGWKALNISIVAIKNRYLNAPYTAMSSPTTGQS